MDPETIMSVLNALSSCADTVVQLGGLLAEDEDAIPAAMDGALLREYQKGLRQARQMVRDLNQQLSALQGELNAAL